MSTLKMAIDALNGDSGRWHEVSEALKGAATAADGLDVYSFSFPANGRRRPVPRLLQPAEQGG